MVSFHISVSVCIAAIIVSTWAAIPYTDVHINIFDSRPRTFEESVLHTMNTTHLFYEEHNVTSEFDTLAANLSANVPYVGELIKTVTELHKTMAAKSEWEVLFTNSIKDEVLRKIFESEEGRMKATMEMIESKIKLLDTNNPELKSRKRIASHLDTELDKMINMYDLDNALARKFPLLGATPIVQLASLIAIFTPYAKALNPHEAMNSQLACEMRDVLLDYRPRAVSARLQQLYANAPIFESKIKVMQMPFNEHGYNKTNPGVINCARQPDAAQSNQFWLKDEFGTDIEFWVNKDDLTCVEDYAALVRHRVEKIFPVDLLSQVCVDPKPKKPSGYGSFTITLQTVFSYGEADGSLCKLIAKFHCNSYIILNINGHNVTRSATRKDKHVFDAGITFVTDKIKKSSRIKIQVWDESSGFLENDHIILETEGDVDSFLKEPLRKGAWVGKKQNAIETVSFWKDE